ncbi:MAG: Fur family transcriptional regulator [Candidatus Rifleibacteriota bacterium]
MKTIKEYVEDLNRVCRKNELRITPQRTEVYKTIVKSKDHPSAESILKKVRKKIPNISHDTVYRTLNWLVDNDLIFQVGVVKGVSRYDGNLKFHYHYVCNNCGIIGDIFPENSSKIKISEIAPENFNVNDVRLELRGTCNKCTQKTRH